MSDITDWNVCDIHEESFPRHSICKGCQIESLQTELGQRTNAETEWREMYYKAKSALKRVRPYINHTRNCDLRISGVSCNCGFNELDAALKGIL